MEQQVDRTHVVDKNIASSSPQILGSLIINLMDAYCLCLSKLYRPIFAFGLRKNPVEICQSFCAS